MGLAVNYTLFYPGKHRLSAVRKLVDRAHRHAEEIGCTEVGAVKEDTEFGDRVASMIAVHHWRSASGQQMPRWAAVPPGGGWAFEVYPGEGSDSGLFGLCLYPSLYTLYKMRYYVPPPNGWGLRSSCTTQYAADHGWDNFLRSHKRILSLLRFWQELGVTVEVRDEGGYWDTQSEDGLRDVLNQYHRLIAMCAGAMKDAAEAVGSGLRVDAPIFKRPDFERLEHEGWQEIKADPVAYLTGAKGKPST